MKIQKIKAKAGLELTRIMYCVYLWARGHCTDKEFSYSEFCKNIQKIHKEGQAVWSLNSEGLK